MNTVLKVIYISFLVVAILIAVSFVTAVRVFAMGNSLDLRSEACRTFHVFAHEVNPEETDGLYCGDVKPQSQQNEDSFSVNTPAVIAEDAVVIVPAVVKTPEQSVTPVETPEDNTPESNLGNPGNTKNVGHSGENPNGRGTMPLDNAGGNGNGEHGNQGQGGQSSLVSLLSGYIFVTFKKGKKEYSAIVSSWAYEGDRNDLWLYVHGNKEKGIEGNCGYIRGARVISSSIAVSQVPALGSDVEKIIKLWFSGEDN